MSRFTKSVRNAQVVGKTFNGAKTFTTSGSRVLDFFKAVGQRGASLGKEFDLAYEENRNLALRALLWSRDIRGGAGEREVFRNVLRHMEKHRLEDVLRMIPIIPELGRFDDLFVFTDPLAKNAAFAFYAKQLDARNGLAAKWAPRRGKEAAEFRNFLGWTPKRYRKTIVNLTKVVETQMCAKQWNSIIYDHVPSVAAARYQKAFYKHDPQGYKTYRENLTKVDPKTGKAMAKVNAGAVFPYDVIKSLRNGDKTVADAQWDALKNFLGDNKILPMIDLSSSMNSWGYYGQRDKPKSNVSPMDIAISIGLYIAGKQTGDFAGMWLNFSTTPKLRQFTGKLSLSNMYNQLNFSDWTGSTNVDAAFDLILRHAKSSGCTQDDLPKMLLIASDMEFNPSLIGNTNFETAKRKFEAAGYTMPQVVFWHINGRADNNPVQMHQTGTAMVSGFSPAIFEALLNADIAEFSPYGIMVKKLMSDRYTVTGLTDAYSV